MAQPTSRSGVSSRTDGGVVDDLSLRRRVTYAHTLRFFEALQNAGVRHVCISPGSRSAPLTLAAAAVSHTRGEAALRIWVHHDERSGGFFALGIAKARREPVALVCTSGTAVANYLPAVVEAHHAGVPLIVVSADRPAELRDRGAGQTIDQVRLFGSHVRWFHELAVPEPAGPEPRIAAAVAARAVAEAWRRPSGPVHLNWPLREPLDPPASSLDVSTLLGESGAQLPRATPRIERRDSAPRSADIDALAALCADSERGVIACGPADEPAHFAESIAALAAATGWPVLAEPTSGLRCGPHVDAAQILGGSDLFLRDSRFARSHPPEVVLRFGRSPTSKAQRLWLESRPPRELVLFDPDRAWNDASGLATRWLDDEPAALARGAAARLVAQRGPRVQESAWLRDFRAAEAAVDRVRERIVDSDNALLQPRAVRELARALPDDAWLYVSSSMPVRDVDAFWPLSRARLRCLSNRGASGIDGVTSSALGAAAVAPGAITGPVCLLTGDLALLHDLGGLLAARRHGLRATIVVLNDDGGGIFSFLPVAAHGESIDFEALFRTPHGVDLRTAADLAGAHYERVGSWDHYRASLKESFAADGLSIVELPVERDANVAQHRAVDAAVVRELAALEFECTFESEGERKMDEQSAEVAAGEA